MKFSCRRFPRLCAAGTALLVGLAVCAAQAQTPKTFKIFVPYPPGSASDVMARLLAEHINHAHGTTMVIENRPGAGGTVGTTAAARAAPDGSNMIVVLNPFAIEPHVRKVSYDPITSFEPVCYLAKTPAVLVVNATSPYKTLGELLAAARAKPGELTLASSGPATATFVAFERLKAASKVDMAFISYPGVPPALNALLGEHVTSVFGVYSPAAELIKTGKLRPLAAGSPERIEALPDVPTIAEAGYPGIDADLWTWLMVPAKTPKDVIAQLSNWIKEALNAPQVRSNLIAQGIYPVAICGDEFATIVRKQYEDYGRFFREHKIRIE